MVRTAAALGVVLVLGLAGLAGEELTLKGSTTVLPIAQLAAEVFAELHPELAVSVQGGGSGTGISAMSASVVSSRAPIDAAFSISERMTFAGSMTPASTMFSSLPLRAL